MLKFEFISPQMRKLNIKSRPGRFFAVALFLYSGYTAIFIGNLTINYILTKPFHSNLEIDKITGLFFFLNSFSYEIYCVGFMITLYTIYNRLALINDFLQTQEDSNEENAEKAFKTVAMFIDKICEVLESTKFCFALNNIIYIFQYLFFSVLGIYSFISFYYSQQIGTFYNVYVIMNLLWGFYYFLFIFWTFFFSEMIKREGKRTEKLLQKLICKNDQMTHRAAQLLHLQLHHRRPIVEWGIFTIDAKAAFHFWGLSFSYLIIILQFEFKSLN